MRTLASAGRAAIAFILLAAASPVFAADPYKSIESSSAQEIVDGMANKTVRGIANVATGWMEFPKQIYLEGSRRGALKAIFVGPLKGLGMTVVRTVSGAGEVFTFFLPIPGFYDPWLDPPFVWQKE